MRPRERRGSLITIGNERQAPISARDMKNAAKQEVALFKFGDIFMPSIQY